MTDPFSTPEQELPRDRWGRPLITPPGGGEPRPYTRVTTFVGSLEDTYHLGQWQMRMTALGMARRPDLVLGAAAIKDPDDRNQKKTLQEISKNALEAANASAAATTGTAIHSMTEAIDRDEDLGYVPPAFLADLEAYRRITRENGLEVTGIEGFCVLDSLEVGGTYDRIYKVTRPLVAPDGQEITGNVIGDLKTGKSVDLGAGKIAMQLGVYSRSKDYDHRTGLRTDLPEVNQDWGIVVHLPAGTGSARLVWFNIRDGYEVASTLARDVRRWRARKDLTQAFAQVTVSDIAPPTAENPGGTDLVLEAIQRAESVEALNGIYFANMASWSPAHNAAAAAKKQALAA